MKAKKAKELGPLIKKMGLLKSEVFSGCAEYYTELGKVSVLAHYNPNKIELDDNDTVAIYFNDKRISLKNLKIKANERK